MYDFNGFVISKNVFCNMLEFSGNEFRLLHYAMVAYLIEFDKYFGDNEFVLSINARGKNTVKVCLERLPFKIVVNDSVNSMRKALTSWVLIYELMIVQIKLCF